MDHNNIKKLYDDLEEKEQALLLAAQFGKSLIDEKEELEKQIENLKREHQNQLEFYEQESYEMKRLIETIRNEYETKISELSDDINYLNKELNQHKILNFDLINSNTKNNENLDLIQELSDKNHVLSKQIKMVECQLSLANQKNQELESSLNEKNKQLVENSILITNYQKEISKLSNKNKELEFVLTQTCTERDKQTQILEEFSKKFLIWQNEKNDLENLIYGHENENYNLRRTNKNLRIKLQNAFKVNTCEKRKCDSSLTSLNRTSNYNNYNTSKTNTTKLNEDDSAFDSISNLDNTSEYDDDFDVDSNFLDAFKGPVIDEIDNNPVEILENMNYFNCSPLLVEGVSWKQESDEKENEIKRTKIEDKNK